MMEFRNAQFNAQGGVDCEVNHPVHGWVPFTASADDPEIVGQQVFAAASVSAASFTPPAPVTVEAWRETATLTRAQFLNACVAAGLITQDVAEQAADGSWPSAFDTFLTGLSPADRIDAKATWSDLGAEGVVWRNSPILALIAADPMISATPEQLDEMFGWVEP